MDIKSLPGSTGQRKKPQESTDGVQGRRVGIRCPWGLRTRLPCRIFTRRRCLEVLDDQNRRHGLASHAAQIPGGGRLAADTLTWSGGRMLGDDGAAQAREELRTSRKREPAPSARSCAGRIADQARAGISRLVPRAGNDPARPYGQKILSLPRLPIPPPRHAVRTVYRWSLGVHWNGGALRAGTRKGQLRGWKRVGRRGRRPCCP
jgi:hypothetical protein